MILPLIACCLLVGASVAPVTFNDSFESSMVKKANNVTYEDSQIIVFTADEVNDCVFANLGSYLNENADSLMTSLDGTSFSQFEFGEITSDDAMYFYDQGNEISFNLVDFTWSIPSSVTAYRWVLTSVGSSIYGSIQSAINSDLAGMSGVDVVTDIVGILVSGLSSLASGLGTGISAFATALAFQDGALSPYFILVVVFAGVALAVGLTTKIFNWLSNLGN